MASPSEPDEIGSLLSALSTLQSKADPSQKRQAHQHLETFQKSQAAWPISHSILSSSKHPPDVKLFAATTLKGKIIYDLDQLPRPSLIALRDSIIQLLREASTGPRPIRTQLCVCLVNLAIQLIEWKDVISFVGNALGSDAIQTTLEFLTILPEEIAEGRKINLAEDDLIQRSKELMEDNAPFVLKLLIQYSQSSADACCDPQLLKCISSWLREIPVADVVKSSLFVSCIINSLQIDSSFDAAIDCLCTIFHDTREVDESLDLIELIYPRLIALRGKIQAAADADDEEALRGLTRLFSEAGEQWIVLIARMPREFWGLVDAILECCARDVDREAIAMSFLFWYELKQMVVLEIYEPARQEYLDVFSRLVDIMINHLKYPDSEDDSTSDLFDGDREQEEKFREFRHQMGDVLKDCCEVISASECLNKSFKRIEVWLSTTGNQGATTKNWQELEAALFAMRAMGRMVSPDEDVILPQIIPLITQIPSHEKLLFQAIMALGRYTEWTAHHPQFLQPQLDFVMAGFKHKSSEVLKAAALAFRFFGTDCQALLASHVVQLHAFYESILDDLPALSQEEVTIGAAAVVAAQAPDAIYGMFKLYCDPIIARMMNAANTAKTCNDESAGLAVADYLQLVTIFIEHVKPRVPPSEENPAVKYCQEILPIIFAVAENFTTCMPVLERVCKCWRYMVISYKSAILPILPSLAQQLAAGFENSRQGCFLWATDSVLREFATGAEFVDTPTSKSIFQFFERQAVAFLRILNDALPQDLADLIEDFFRLLVDALIYYHTDLLQAPICPHILSAATSALSLESQAPLTATLHFLRDFCSYGTSHPNSSYYSAADDLTSASTSATANTEGSREAAAAAAAAEKVQLQNAVKMQLLETGGILLERCLIGMIFSFPPDCIADASAVVMTLFEILPDQARPWLQAALEKLPANTTKTAEISRLLQTVEMKLQEGNVHKLRAVLQDFTVAYRRRNVMPREGLAGIDLPRFRYTG